MKRRFTEDHYRKEPWFTQLVDALLACRGKEGMADFLRDIATLSELQALSERLEVARLLGTGMSYRDIAKKTGASTTTVTRVAQFLENGCGGYRTVLGVQRHHRMHTNESATGPVIVPEAKRMLAQQPTKSSLQKYLEKK